MRKRPTKKEEPAEDRATAAGIVGAAEQDVELTAEQLEQIAARVVRRLGGLKSGKGRVAKSGQGRRSTAAGKAVPKHRKRKP